MMKNRVFTAALAAASLTALSACEQTADTEEMAEVEDMGTQTIATIVGNTDGLDTVADLLGDVGIADAFDGNAAYTVFAPTDTALEGLGEDFQGNEARPALLAVLREHIVPGYLTADDIRGAIESNGGPVEMTTMGESTLTFSVDGENVVVTTTGGDASAMVTGELRGANGVVVPVETVLKDLEPAA